MSARRVLLERRLADDHRAGLAQAGDLEGVARRTEVLEREAAIGGRHVEGVVVVLDGDGDAEQRPAGAACVAPRRPLWPERSHPRRRSHRRGNRTAPCRSSVDAVQIGPRDLLRGHHPRLHVGAELADRLFHHVVLDGWSCAFFVCGTGGCSTTASFLFAAGGSVESGKAHRRRCRSWQSSRSPPVVRSPIDRCRARLRGGGFDGGPLGRYVRGVDALAEDHEVEQRLASARRQRQRVHVSLEVPFVARIGQRRAERIVEPVAGKRHGAAERARRSEDGDLRRTDQRGAG